MRSWRSALADQLDPRVARILFLGFSSGLPMLLVYSTLSAWLKEEGISKTAIGLFAWVSTAYTFKFLWTPLIDRVQLPLLGAWLGRRRSWMLLSQIVLAVAIFGLAHTDPSSAVGPVVAWSILVAFASATQDMAIDAYRIESLETSQLGAGAANNTFGYRFAMLVAGGGTLLIADQWGWTAAYTVMAALVGVGIVTTLVIAEPAAGAVPQKVSFVAAVVDPFRDFMQRPGWLLIVCFIALYRYSDALLGNMANPFYLELGFTKTDIGLISKGYGLVMTLAGTFVGGLLFSRLGVARALLIAGVAQTASNLLFVALAMKGPSIAYLACCISVENFSSGFATVVFVAYLSSLCSVAYTATQYALLSSAAAAARTIFSSGGGWLADHVSWPVFFAISTLVGVPSLVLLLILMRRFPPADAAPAEKLALADDD